MFISPPVWWIDPRWQVSIHPVTCSLPLQRHGGENQKGQSKKKKKKTKKNKIKTIIREEEKKKRERVEKRKSDAKAITRFQQAHAQPLSMQGLLWKNCPSVLLLLLLSYSMDYLFCSLGSAVLAVSLLVSCTPPAYSLGCPSEKEKALCQSPVLSDQVILNIPCVEGVMFSIKFT